MAQPLLTSNQVEFPTPLQSCRVATTTSLASLSGLLTIDGVTLVAFDRVLVKDGTVANPGTTSVDNGVYVASAGAWSRAPDFDGSPSDETKSGDWVFVTSGTANGTTNWTIATPNPIVVGVTPITFFQSAGAGGGGGYVPLTGGTMTGLLILSGNPVVANGAATKTYVDTNFVLKAGDTMTGVLNGTTINASVLTSGGGTAGFPGHAFSVETNTGMYRPSPNNLGFTVGGTQMVNINATGTLSVAGGASPAITVNAGNGPVNAANYVFPAVQVASADVNTLDDYEEGTWTVTDASGAGLTFTVINARYVKIGRMVIVTAGTISWPVTGDTNIAKLTLPFVCTSGGFGFPGQFAMPWFSGSATIGLTTGSSSAITLYDANTGGVRLNSEFSGLDMYGFSCIYWTTN